MDPTMLNIILYDGKLHIMLPSPNVSFLALIDDITTVANWKHNIIDADRDCKKNQLTYVGLELAAHKTEAIVFTINRKHNH